MIKAQILEPVFDGMENNVGKQQKACYHYCCLLLQYFAKAHYARTKIILGKGDFISPVPSNKILD